MAPDEEPSDPVYVRAIPGAGSGAWDLLEHHAAVATPTLWLMREGGRNVASWPSLIRLSVGWPVDVRSQPTAEAVTAHDSTDEPEDAPIIASVVPFESSGTTNETVTVRIIPGTVLDWILGGPHEQ
jgi:hypothetical protein